MRFEVVERVRGNIELFDKDRVIVDKFDREVDDEKVTRWVVE
jgi:hypothetical protein